MNSEPRTTQLDQYRLPRTVVPSRYELTLEPDFDAATFAGSETVTVDVREPTSEVVLNALDLEITEAWLETGDGTRIAAAVASDPEAERISLTLETEARPGPHALHARFNGTLNDKLVGFYRSTFDDPDGAAHTLATTQFEATHARRAFPCWDEPDLKATFAVTLVVGEDLLAVSNAAEVSSEPVDDGTARKRVRFAETMVMSTYLVAFVVGPLEVTDPVDAGGTPLRVVYPPGKGHLTGFALDVGAAALRYFGDYYGIGYPADKLDLVAIPDFAFGAMENLGCVTFREVALLVDTATADQPELERVADVVNHELAHMWFGDLVTMRWWNGIWLNEAFATFMEMLATDRYRPDWDRWTTFGISRSAAFDTDSLSTTRAIEFPVVSPAEAEGMFDILTYEKGAAVVRMLEQYLGAEEFKGAIAGYLEAHRFSNTETTDLWDAIEAATGQPARRIMDTWIFQGGYPVVSARLSDDRSTLSLGQERFRFTPGADTESARWAVPVLVRAGSATDTAGSAQLTKLLLDGDSAEVDLGGPVDWVVVNAGGSGFYRTRYSTDLLGALTGTASPDLTPLERYGLVDDAWASTVAGTSAVGDMVGLLRACGDEDDLSVWQRMVGVLGSLDRVAADARQPYQGFVRALVGPPLRRLGAEPAEGEPDRTTTLRATLFRALGILGADDEIRARAEDLHARASDGAGPPRSLVNAALDVIAPDGDSARFDQFLARSEAAATPQDRLRYVGALADFEAPDLFGRLLELTLSDTVRSQDGPQLLHRALLNRVNGPQAWTFVRDHWDQINARFPSSGIPRLLGGVRTLTDIDTASDVEAFLTAHPVPQGSKQVAQHLERLRINVAFAARVADDLSTALGSPA